MNRKGFKTDITVLYLLMTKSKDEIIDSTLKLVRQHGWDKISVRMIAKEIGYSTIKIYSEFGSKEKLLLEIQKKGFRQLERDYYQAIEKSDTPETSLENIAISHIQYATKQPVFYELMFSFKFNHCRSEAATIKQKVASIIYEIIREVSVSEPKTAFLQFYSMLSGYVEISKELSMAKDGFMESTVKQFVKNYVHGIK